MSPKAPQRNVRRWERELELAKAELAVFDELNEGVVSLTKEDDRHFLLNRIGKARLGLLRARLDEEDAEREGSLRSTPALLLKRRGRPHRRTYSREALIAEYRRVRIAIGRDFSQDEFCASIQPTRIEKRTLQNHLNDYRLPWPIE